MRAINIVIISSLYDLSVKKASLFEKPEGIGVAITESNYL